MSVEECGGADGKRNEHRDDKNRENHALVGCQVRKPRTQPLVVVVRHATTNLLIASKSHGIPKPGASGARAHPSSIFIRWVVTAVNWGMCST